MLLVLASLLMNITPAKAIIGGTPVSSDDRIAKSTVLLYGQSSNGGFICTGTILNSQYILSAAHCVTDVKGMMVIFGTDGSTSEKIKALMSAGRTRKVVNVNHNIDYPNTPLGSNFPHNDISLIRFEGGLPAGYTPATVLTPSVMAKYVKPGATVVIAGFGQREDKSTGILYKNVVKVQDVQSKTVIVGESGSSACHGDSGGPAFLDVGGKLYVWGALSRGPAGCTSYAIYTPLTSNFFGQMGNPQM